MDIVILPDQVLQVIWFPADDVTLSPVTYVINVTQRTGRDSVQHMHPVTKTTLTGLNMFSSGNVSLQARNPTSSSEIVIKTFRMVNITGDGG